MHHKHLPFEQSSKARQRVTWSNSRCISRQRKRLHHSSNSIKVIRTTLNWLSMQWVLVFAVCWISQSKKLLEANYILSFQTATRKCIVPESARSLISKVRASNTSHRLKCCTQNWNWCSRVHISNCFQAWSASNTRWISKKESPLYQSSKKQQRKEWWLWWLLMEYSWRRKEGSLLKSWGIWK